MYIALLLHLLLQLTNSSRIQRANDKRQHDPNEYKRRKMYLQKPAVTPSFPHDPQRIEYENCDWVNYNRRFLPKSMNTKPYDVKISDRDFFTKHGHVTLSKVLNLRELNYPVPIRSSTKKNQKLRLGKVLRSCAQEVLDSTAIWNEGDRKGAPPFHRIFNMWRGAKGKGNKNKFMSDLVTAPRFSKIAADLLGVKKVRLYQDSLFWKAASHNRSRWHQDKVASPFHDSTKMITMWMPLEKSTYDEMGALRFASGSHHDGRSLDFSTTFHGTVSDTTVISKYDIHFAGYIDKNQTRQRMKLGDASFHKGFTLHSAGENVANKTRVALAVQWVADESLMNREEWMGAVGKTRTGDDVAGFHEWMQAITTFSKTSDNENVVNHPFFPIVYDATNKRAHIHARKNLIKFTEERWVWKHLNNQSSVDYCKDDPHFSNYRQDGCEVYGVNGLAHNECTRDGSLAYINCAASCRVLCEARSSGSTEDENVVVEEEEEDPFWDPVDEKPEEEQDTEKEIKEEAQKVKDKQKEKETIPVQKKIQKEIIKKEKKIKTRSIVNKRHKKAKEELEKYYKKTKKELNRSVHELKEKLKVAQKKLTKLVKDEKRAKDHLKDRHNKEMQDTFPVMNRNINNERGQTHGDAREEL